jgi:exopolysaccharide biosynthesis polyprenyl glycosylphosphotransferase
VKPPDAVVMGETVIHYDEIVGAADDRTLEILERRRKTATVRRRGWLVRRMLVAADVIGLSLSFAGAELLFRVGSAKDHVPTTIEVLVLASTLPLWVVIAKVYGLYAHDEERTDHSTSDDAVGVFHLVTVGTWTLFLVQELTGVMRAPPAKFALFWILAIILITLCRVAARTYCRSRLTYLQNTVIVGAGDVGQLIGRKLLQHPEYGINLVGFVDSEPKERRDDLEHLTVLGAPERLPAIVRVFDVERVIFAFSKEPHDEALDLVRSLKDLDVQVDIVPRFFEVVGPNVGIHTVEGIPLLGLPPLHLSRSARILKRGVDLVGAAVGLLLLAPLFAVIACRIKHETPGPVFFRQIRMGRGDKTFRIYKFRTMVDDADRRKSEVAHLNMHAANGGDPRMFKVPEDPRITPFGAFLRRYSLDELPQLINVVKGEMSLVGPRPLILDEDRYIIDWARKRLDLTPGITGLWQVLGRSEIPFEEMTKLDYLYVTNWSLWGDVRLIFGTIPALTRTRRAY